MNTSKDASLQSVSDLAERLLELSKTYQPTPDNEFFGTLPPVIAQAEAFAVAASTPSDYMTTLIRNMIQTAVLRTLLSLKALQALSIDTPTSVTTIAAKTGAQATLLDRLLRVLAAGGILSQTENGDYLHSHLTAGMSGPAGLYFTHCYDMTVLPLMRLPGYLTARGPIEPISTTHNPMTWTEGQEGKSPFAIIAQSPERMAAMHQMMIMAERFRPYTGFYDYSKLIGDDTDRVVFVDVGGGNGHVVQRMLEAHPDINAAQCVLQDRDEVIQLATREKRLPSSVQMMAHDYFAVQPVKSARAYHLRAVAHDLSDDDLVKVLANIVPVMAPDSRILIADCIVPDHHMSPLVGLMDMMMLSIGGKERSEREFRAILDKVGLKVESIARANEMGWSILEAVLK